MYSSAPKSGRICHMWLGYHLPRFTRFAAPVLLLVSLAGHCSAQSDAQSVAQNRAQTAAVAACPQDRTALAESFSMEKLWRWQRRLQLEDWKIAVVVTRASELKPKTSATSTGTRTRRPPPFAFWIRPIMKCLSPRC